MPDMAKINTIVAALDINLERKFNLPHAGPLLIQVPDQVAGGLRTVLTLTKDWSRPLTDRDAGDGVIVTFSVADKANTSGPSFRQSGEIFVAFQPVNPGPYELLKVKEVVWPKEGDARVYQVVCQRRKQGYRTYFEQKK